MSPCLTCLLWRWFVDRLSWNLGNFRAAESSSTSQAYCRFPPKPGGTKVFEVTSCIRRVTPSFSVPLGDLSKVLLRSKNTLLAAFASSRESLPRRLYISPPLFHFVLPQCCRLSVQPSGRSLHSRAHKDVETQFTVLSVKWTHLFSQKSVHNVSCP